MPEGGTAPAVEAIAALPLIIAASSAGWIGVGTGVRSRMPHLASGGWIERVGALLLAAFAAVVTGSALGWAG